ncbi:hypothetical protein [Henriciella marina]|uniref:hypothetical protein n=1 Tax=Henriciella marina TaxID=453851 RepID=UPI0022B0B9B0|nr:hypothetical protein [Henriciella marina]
MSYNAIFRLKRLSLVLLNIVRTTWLDRGDLDRPDLTAVSTNDLFSAGTATPQFSNGAVFWLRENTCSPETRDEFELADNTATASEKARSQGEARRGDQASLGLAKQNSRASPRAL